MILVARHKVAGPAAGTRYLRPEFHGEQRWVIRSTTLFSDGWKDERQVSLKQPACLSVARDAMFEQIREQHAVEGVSVVDSSLEFFARRKK